MRFTCISQPIAMAADRPRPDWQWMYTPPPRLRWCSMNETAVRIASTVGSRCATVLSQSYEMPFLRYTW